MITPPEYAWQNDTYEEIGFMPYPDIAFLVTHFVNTMLLVLVFSF